MKTSKLNDPNNDNWETPQYLYDELNKEFNFDFDPCPLKHDISKWNGLEIDWKKSNFCNPPYSRPLKDQFIIKGFNEWKKGKNIVFLIPANTDTKIFHEYIYIPLQRYDLSKVELNLKELIVKDNMLLISVD